jgi:hypothetical protein
MIMSTPEMDYFAQKPDIDLKAFFEGKGVRMSDVEQAEPVARPAPPPKDTAWVVTEPTPDTEEE